MARKRKSMKYLFLILVACLCIIFNTAIATNEAVKIRADELEWRIKGVTDGDIYELIAIENNEPIYYITCNADAAVSTGADVTRNSYFVDGNSLTIGLWDAGWPLFMHQEFRVSDTESRITIMDSESPVDSNSEFIYEHSTHVAGTIGAQGIDPNAKGMAPAVKIHSYNWDADIAEMTTSAASQPSATEKLYLSNHSYSVLTGWEYGNFRYGLIQGDLNGDGIVNFIDLGILQDNWLIPDPDPAVDIAPAPNGDGIVNFLDYAVILNNWLKTGKSIEGLYWFGVWGQREDRKFGWYNTRAYNWDFLCYSAPYYLPFKAAGNDRDDEAPEQNEPFWYLDPNDPNDPNDPDGGRWVQGIYDVNDSNYPWADNDDSNGYDTIPVIGCAKNIITVGAVEDANNSGLRDKTLAAMTIFSGWGPTDDGRIKPDIVSNGFELWSPIAVNDVNYDYRSGTSQACASAAGSAALLVEYYNILSFPNQNMRASTLKALLIHTADDILNNGPDYRSGWGLIDVNEAAHYITTDSKYIKGINVSPPDPCGIRIIEGALTQDGENTYLFESDGTKPIRATLCWTDPPGNPIEPLEDTNDVNDVNDGVLDNNTPCLINDLDLRITNEFDDPNIFYPYILDPNNPSADATRGDNVLDNVEQILIPDPNAGFYKAVISHKGTITNSVQHYSLILSEPVPIVYIYVDDDANNDPVPGVPDAAVGGANSDPNEDGTILHPYDSIQKGIDDPNAINGAIIIVKDGYYTGIGNYNINLNGKDITVRSENGPDDCTVDCESTDEEGRRAFIIVSGETTTTVLQGLTIINGYAKDPDWPQEPYEDPSGHGGAIYCRGSSPWIRDCVITDNRADGGGGGIFCHDNSNVFISDCDVSFNWSGYGYEHELYEIDPADDNDINQPGGGIFSDNASPAIINCIITFNNAAGSGGGIGCRDSDAFILNSFIVFNDCWARSDKIEQDGGGIHCNGGNPIIFNCDIEYNFSNDSGGGIALLQDSDVTVESNDVNSAWIVGCIITNNECGASGGGVHCEGFFNRDPCEPNLPNYYIRNCVICDNKGYWGGGVSSFSDSLVQIQNCTIAWNRAPYQVISGLTGGLLCDYGNATVRNSIIWDNKGFQVSGLKDANDLPDVVDPCEMDANDIIITYSNIKMVDANEVYDPNDVWKGQGNINVDPFFASIVRGDYHLKTAYPNGRWNPQTGQFDRTDTVTSPCINSGDPQSDYSFEPAPNGGRVNMGAYGNTLQASKSGEIPPD